MHALPESDPRRASLTLLQSPLASGVPGVAGVGGFLDHGIRAQSAAPPPPPSWDICGPPAAHATHGDVYLPHQIEGLDEDPASPGGLLLVKPPESADVDAPESDANEIDAPGASGDSAYTLCGMTTAFSEDPRRT
jgi:hypothetical protein